MKRATTIRVHAATDPTRHVELSYHDRPVTLGQARIAGRRMLVPEIDLAGYRCRAVLDLVQLTFELARPTQFRYLQTTLKSLIGRKVYVEPFLPQAGGVATVFTVTIQEPSFRILVACGELLTSRFGEAAAPIVNMLEVSVDFLPRVHSDESRGRMVAVLGRHLYPAQDFQGRMSTRPRFSWGSSSRQNSFTLKRSKIELEDEDIFQNSDGDILQNPDGDMPPPIDATYYIGHKIVGPMWRVMDKIIDRQNLDAGTLMTLPDDKKRARIEVRLDQLELKKLGVFTLPDLLRVNLAKLQGRYFKFMLPTFSTRGTGRNAADEYWDRQRNARFLNVGVVGLRAMDERRRHENAKHRPLLIEHLHARGIGAPAPDRNGRGAFGTFIAYVDLNDRVAMALRKLDDREREGVA